MGPAQATQGPPHGGFTQLLALVFGPPGALLQDCRIGCRFQASAQDSLLAWSNLTRQSGDGPWSQRPRLLLKLHHPFDRDGAHAKAPCGYAHGLTFSHRTDHSFS